jgi:Protein of unknown function (DUF2934)
LEACAMSGFERLVREKAYELWERAGRPDGRNDEFWHASKQELETELAAVEEVGQSLDPAAEAPPVVEGKPAPANGGPAPRRRRSAKGD